MRSAASTTSAALTGGNDHHTRSVGQGVVPRVDVDATHRDRPVGLDLLGAAPCGAGHRPASEDRERELPTRSSSTSRTAPSTINPATPRRAAASVSRPPQLAEPVPASLATTMRLTGSRGGDRPRPEVHTGGRKCARRRETNRDNGSGDQSEASSPRDAGDDTFDPQAVERIGDRARVEATQAVGDLAGGRPAWVALIGRPAPEQHTPALRKGWRGSAPRRGTRASRSRARDRRRCDRSPGGSQRGARSLGSEDHPLRVRCLIAASRKFMSWAQVSKKMFSRPFFPTCGSVGMKRSRAPPQWQMITRSVGNR